MTDFPRRLDGRRSDASYVYIEGDGEPFDKSHTAKEQRDI